MTTLSARPGFRRTACSIAVGIAAGLGLAASWPVWAQDLSTIKVPPRTQTGAVLRIRGKGVARKGKEAGDLYVELAVQIPTSDAPDSSAAHKPGPPAPQATSTRLATTPP